MADSEIFDFFPNARGIFVEKRRRGLRDRRSG
jgi:hypothetical protein